MLIRTPRRGFPREALGSPRDARGCSADAQGMFWTLWDPLGAFADATQGMFCHLRRSLGVLRARGQKEDLKVGLGCAEAAGAFPRDSFRVEECCSPQVGQTPPKTLQVSPNPGREECLSGSASFQMTISKLLQIHLKLCVEAEAQIRFWVETF